MNGDSTKPMLLLPPSFVLFYFDEIKDGFLNFFFLVRDGFLILNIHVFFSNQAKHLFSNTTKQRRFVASFENLKQKKRQPCKSDWSKRFTGSHNSSTTGFCGDHRTQLLAPMFMTYLYLFFFFSFVFCF